MKFSACQIVGQEYIYYARELDAFLPYIEVKK